MSTFYFVRHAKAGSRGHWQGDDRLRPLSKKGVKQAGELIDVFKPFNVSAIYSSPYLRCVQTLEPLAQDRGLEIQETPALAEGRGLPGACAGRARIHPGKRNGCLGRRGAQRGRYRHE